MIISNLFTFPTWDEIGQFILNNISNWWNSLSKEQQMNIIGTIVLIIVGIYLLIKFISKLFIYGFICIGIGLILYFALNSLGIWTFIIPNWNNISFIGQGILLLITGGIILITFYILKLLIKEKNKLSFIDNIKLKIKKENCLINNGIFNPKTRQCEYMHEK